MVDVLVIDDNENIRFLYSFAFEDEYKVLGAKDGLEGLKLYNEYHPRLMLVDLLMQGITGLDFIKAVRANDKESIIILISGCILPQESITEILEAGATKYLSKPIDINELKTLVRQLLLPPT